MIFFFRCNQRQNSEMMQYSYLAGFEHFGVFFFWFCFLRFQELFDVVFIIFHVFQEFQ